MKKTEERINDAILKVALGCRVEEVTEEYAEVDGELKLTKRKKTKRDIPPDLKAVQLLLSGEGGGSGDVLPSMSEEELEAEKERLLSVLREEEVKEEAEKETKKKKSGGRVASKTAKKTKRRVKRKAVKGS